MTDDRALEEWFCREVLPLERSLTSFIRRNWRMSDDIPDLRQTIYEKVIHGARRDIPLNARHYVFVVARNHLINCAKHARVVEIGVISELENLDIQSERFATERHLDARDTLRHLQIGLGRLPPRIRQILMLRKVEGLSVRETAERLGIGRDAVNHQLMMGMKALADFMLGGSGRVVRKRYEKRPHNDAVGRDELR
jgi:RNA polymerase sigma factor (sigma-70 family)